MGRPLNKKFFGDGAGLIAGSGWFTGEGAAEAVYIVQQKSNLKYLVESEAGPGTRSEILQLVQGAPTQAGQLQITVTPELLAAAAEATFTIDTDGAGAVSAVAITDGGSGYFAGGTFTITDLTLTGNDDAVITYTVDIATQSIDSATVTTPGTGYTINQSGVAVNTADIPDAGSVDQSARIINAHTVKTFEGVIFKWPAAGGTGSPDHPLPEADLGTQ